MDPLRALRVLPALVLLLLPGAAGSAGADVCMEQTMVGHTGLLGAVRVPVTVRAPCGRILPGGRVSGRRRLPAVLLVNGALVRGGAYGGLGAALARRGFVTFVAQYSPDLGLGVPPSRVPGCPANGTWPTTALVLSLAQFVAAHPRVDPASTALFAHSLGAPLSLFALFGGCDKGRATPSLSAEVIAAFCEGAPPRPSPALRFRVLAFFEGGSYVPITVPDDQLVVSMYSPFFPIEGFPGAGDARENFRRNITGGRDNVLEVAFENGTNHFAPVDYQPESRHAKTRCSLSRIPPESNFTTTRQEQDDVVRTIADVISLSFYYYDGMGKAGLPQLVNSLPRLLYVKSAVILSELKKML